MIFLDGHDMLADQLGIGQDRFHAQVLLRVDVKAYQLA